MKSWLAKLRISNALDRGQPLSAALERQAGDASELQQFQQQTLRLHHALRQGRTVSEAPAGLHEGILRAVERQGAGSALTQTRGGPLWQLGVPTGAFACLLLWGLSMSTHHQPSSAAVAPVAIVLEQSQQLAQNAPNQMVAPLSDELKRLNRDVDQAARFLEASVP